RIAAHQAALIKAREEIEGLQRLFLASGSAGVDGHGAVRILTEPKEIGALSSELCYSAKREVLSLETPHATRPRDVRTARLPPTAALERGVRFRNIYSRDMLELDYASELVRICSEGGWELRAVDELPTKMVLVDDAALLPLGRTGM